jgi:hypothetical protein
VLTYTGLGPLLTDPIALRLIGLIFIQLIFVTMVYGPIAAYLVEAFPARIRYTALSLPYHIGNGVFGGMLPLIGLYVVSRRATSTPGSTTRSPSRRSPSSRVRSCCVRPITSGSGTNIGARS